MWHKYQPNTGWWACNIPDIQKYIETLRQQIAPEKLTPERLKLAIDEDSYGLIDVAECRALLQEYQS
ncbi:MAG: hypothetical protein HY669_00625 [Chloroflexi bacterium]|nr:hypothetical protein [Chloroflexota bacterium]